MFDLLLMAAALASGPATGLGEPSPRQLAIAGRHSEAIAAIDKEIAEHPADLDLQLERARFLYWAERHEQARDALSLIAASSPDYPGLADLSDQVDRALTGGQHATSAGGLSLSASTADVSISGRKATWNTVAATAYWSEPRYTVSISAEREKRAVADTRLKADLSGVVGAVRWRLGGTSTPDADFRERWSVHAGAGRLVGRHEVGIDLRHASYASNEIDIIQPYATLRAPSARISVKIEAVLARDENGLNEGMALRADYLPESRTGAFVSFASYPEAERAVVRMTKLAAIGGRLPVARRVDMHVSIEREERASTYKRTAGTLAIIYRFGR
ncbi:YaiO family outer membrane beta-barrel protein [Croceicoccus gelatinilyticus]|uniref:YaiO family outer membrane beta-barrel protein n=1 Tax=Croceicoccus gelatinilyticus TaxID=2835536 RepID=UPI001BD1890E|nr:YaiO family outer membrane beta-barrel protein [Croceicoccus gelatinilyticus]